MRKCNVEAVKLKTGRGFTLIEVLLVIFVLSVGIITIMQAVTRTTSYISETAQRTIALNLAKEGIEAVYNIRNTNWRRRSSQRNQCRLKADPMVDEMDHQPLSPGEGLYKGSQHGCADDHWMGRGNYVLMRKGGDTPYYVALYKGGRGGADAWLNWHLISDESAITYQLENDDILAGTSLFGANGGQMIRYQEHWITAAEYLTLTPDEQQKVDHRYGKYFRNLLVFGIFPKDTNQVYDMSLAHCVNGLGQCGDASAKELHFCVEVIYTTPYRGRVHLCGIMTNFLE